MGFMAGFGPAFADSYNSAVDRNEKRKDDVFKLTYSNYLENKKERKEQSTKDGYAIQQAQKLAEETGQPPEVVGKIAADLRAGVSYSEMKDSLENGKYTVTYKNGEPQVSDKPMNEGSAVAPVDPRDQQTQDAFQKGVQDKVAVGDAVAPTGVGSAGTPNTPTNPNLPTAVKPQQVAQAPEAPTFNPAQQRRMDAAYKRIAEIEGKTVEQIRQEMESPRVDSIQKLQNPNVQITYARTVIPGKEFVDYGKAKYLAEQYRQAGNEAMAKKYEEMADFNLLEEEMKASAKEGSQMFLVRDPDSASGFSHKIGKRTPDGLQSGGQTYQIEREIEKEELALWERVIGSNEGIKDYRQNQIDTLGVIKTADRLFSLLGEDSVSLTTSGRFAQIADRFKREVENYAKLGAAALSDPDLEKKMLATEADIDQKIKSGAIKDVADRTALINSLLNVMSYRTAKLEGQSSRDASDRDITRMDAIVQASTDPTTMKQGIAEYLRSHVQSLNDKAIQYNTNNDVISNIKTTYGYSPFPDELVQNFDDLIKTTGSQQAYESVMSAVGGAVQTGTTGNKSLSANEGRTVVGPDGNRYIIRNGKLEKM